MALTATSPPPDPPEVEKLWVSGSTVYAQLTPEEYSDDPVLRSMSADGGRSWARLDGGIPTDAEPASGRACRSDGICFDAMGGSIRETRLDGETKTSFELSRSQRAALDWRRPDGGAHPDDMFIHVAVIRGPDGESVVASAKDQGVVVLGPSGRWTRIAVLGAEPTSLSGSVFAMNVATFALLASMPIALVATVATALTRQHRNGWTKAGSAVGGLVFGGVFWAAGVGVWALGSFNRADPNRTAIILTLLALATLLVPVSAVRATGRRRPSTPSS